MMRIFIKVLFTFVFVLLPIQLMADGKKVALVIGNANYTTDSGFLPLSNPLNDATAIAEKLYSLGFTISGNKPLLDGTKHQMSAAIEQFMYDSRDADVVLFYYSGHGASRDNKEALLLPLGETFKEFNFRESCIGLETVVSAMNRYDTNGKSKFKIIILDACRNAPYSNPLDRSKDASDVNKGLVRTTLPKGFAICYATEPGETAIERANERYSVYTEALLAELSSGKNFPNMMAAVSTRVKEKTNNKQKPKYEHDFTGEFSFSTYNLSEFNNNDQVISGRYIPFKKSDKWGLYDNLTLKIHLQPKYSFIEPYENSELYRVNIENKFGCINSDGVEIIPVIYENVWGLDNPTGLICCKDQNNKYGYLNHKGEIVLPFIYDNCNDFSEGLAAVVKDHKVGYIDTRGNLVIDYQYSGSLSLMDFKEGLAVVKKNGKYGYIDRFGRTVIDFKYEDALPFKDGIASIKEKQYGWGAINKNGDIIIPTKYNIDPFQSLSEGFCVISKDNLQSYINYKTGGILIPYKYNKIRRAKHNLFNIFEVKKDGYYGCVDFMNNEIIPCVFDMVFTNIYNDMIEVLKKDENNKNKYGLYDKNGQMKLPIIYERINELYKECNLYCVGMNGKFGVVDINNNTILPFIYDTYFEFRFDGNIACTKRNGKDVYLDKNLNEIELK